MIVAAILTVETVSFMTMMTRWALKYAAGDYDRQVKIKGRRLRADAYEIVSEANVRDDFTTGAFAGHVFMGLLPPLAIACMLGFYLHGRRVAAEARALELKDAHEDVEKLLR